MVISVGVVLFFVLLFLFGCGVWKWKKKRNESQQDIVLNILPPSNSNIDDEAVWRISLYDELEVPSQNVQLEDIIGEGEFGVVWKATFNDEIVAVKMLKGELLDI